MKRLLPDDTILLKHYRDGLSNRQIAELYGVTVQAVAKRLDNLGIKRYPYANAATAIFEAAWPNGETGRVQFTDRSRARSLHVFLRRRLGDPTLSVNQRYVAELFERKVREEGVVLDFDRAHPEGPWVFVHRVEADGRRVIRWPEGKELPPGDLAQALDLPSKPWS